MLHTDTTVVNTWSYRRRLEHTITKRGAGFVMESEMNSIQENRTWEVVELPKNQHALPCRWVFQLKEISYSASPKYKERIVAKGFRQEYVDFDKIFSPIVKMTTLLRVVATKDFQLV